MKLMLLLTKNGGLKLNLLKNKIVILLMALSLQADFLSVPAEMGLFEKASKGDVTALAELKNLKNKESLFLLGIFYEKDGTQKDYYLESFRLGKTEALYNLGISLSDANESVFYLKQALDNGIKESLIPLYDLTKDEDYLKQAADENILNANLLYAKLLEKQGRDNLFYTQKLYDLKEDFVLHYKNVKDFKIIKEGVAHKNGEAILRFSKDLSDEDAIKLLKEVTLPEAKYRLGLIYMNINKKDALGYFREYATMTNSEVEEIKQICQETNYCLSF